MSRLLSVSRLHTVAWPATIGWPWGILASSFALNLLLFAAIGDAIADGGSRTGGLSSIYITVMIVAIGWVTQVYPFALGMSVTRREFYTATTGYAVIQAFAFAVPLYLLKVIEDATNGWGLSLSFFGVGFLSVHNGLLQIVVYAVPMLLMSFLGIFFGTVFNRWGSNGMFAFTVGAIVVLGAAATLITWRRAWRQIGHWFATQNVETLVVGWPMVLAVLFAGAGYLVIRRAPATL